MMFKRSHNSIAKGLFSSYFLMMLLTLGVMFILSYLFFYNTLEKKSIQYNELMVLSVHDRIESQLSEFVNVSFQIYHPEVHALINQLYKMGYNPTSWEYRNNRTKVLAPLSLLERDTFVRRAQSSVFFYDRQGKLYLHNGVLPRKSGSELVETAEYKSILDNKGTPTIHVVDAEEWFMEPSSVKDDKMVLIGRRIVNTLHSRDLGLFIIAVNFNSITESIEHVLPDADNYFVLMDPSREVLFSRGPGNEETHRGVIDSLRQADGSMIRHGAEAYLVNQYHSAATGWTYVNLTPYSDIRKEVAFFSRIILLCVIAAFVGSLLIAVYFSRRIIRPITKLEHFAYDIESGLLDTRLNIKSYREFNHLANVFNHMIIQHRQMIENNYLLNLRKQEAELKALQAQINPHFLYNSLNSINAYAQQSDNRDIVDMTCALSDMLRYSLGKTSDYTTVGDEVAHCSNYLFIQNIRYGGTVQFEKRIDERSLACKAVPFVLQPLVENALQHGLRGKEDDKRIQLDIEIKDDMVELHVRDNGQGISAEALNNLRDRIFQVDMLADSQGSGDGQRIGLRNVHQRVRMVFGDRYGLSLASEPGQGTHVRVTIPVS